MLGEKTIHRKFKKIEIIPSIFSDHNGMKPDINNKRKTGKLTNTWKLTLSCTTTGSKEKLKEK